MEVRTYGSFDDMMADMAKAEEAANAAILPSQTKIGWGDYWMRAMDDFVIFGSIYTREAAKAACIAAGGSEQECSAEDRRLVDSFERGYRYGWAYSVVVPDGEPGSTHISTMVQISADEFEEAKALNWDIDQIANRPWFLEHANAIVEEARNAAST
jgi:hypothetical protein